MKEFKYVITDAEGIHARPATMLVKKAAGFKSDINIEAEGKKVNAKGVLGVMGLGAKKGAEITVTVDGEDEEKIIKRILKTGESDHDDYFRR